MTALRRVTAVLISIPLALVFCAAAAFMVAIAIVSAAVRDA